MLHGSGIFFELFSNFAIIMVTVFAYGLIKKAFGRKHKYWYQVAMGALFGVSILACMSETLLSFGGMLIDMRNVFIILSAIFGGPISAVISAIFAIVYRLTMLDLQQGAFAGCLAICLATVSGCVASHFHEKIDSVPNAAIASFLATVFILPSFFLVRPYIGFFEVLTKVVLPYGWATFLGVFLGGLSLEMEENLYKAQMSLRHSEEKYKHLFERLIDICFRAGSDGKIIIISPACERVLGYTVEEVIGTKFLDYFVDAESVGSFKLLMKKNGFVSNFETVLKKKYGDEAWVSINARELFDENGKYAGVEALARDITLLRNTLKEKDQLQENFIQVQKMESLGIMAGGVAHDFNNALAGIMGGAEILQDPSISSEMHKKYVNLILSSAERAGALTRKLLTFSRKEVFTKKPVDIVALLNDTVSILFHTIDRKIVVKTNFQLENAWVIGDGALLQSVFLNLGINASHALSGTSKPEIKFALNTVDLNKDYCDHSQFKLLPGKYVEITVRDNGHGMPPEVLTQVFKPFFTTKEQGKGTGLGLSAAYGTIQSHSGAITVYSEVDHGTVFHVYIPFSEQQQQKLTESQESLPTGSGTILLIDDEELVRAVALTMLTKLGYNVFMAENGEEGLEIYKAHKKEIQLVVLDMIMPVMSGRETFFALNKLAPSLPIVIASGFIREEDLAIQKKMGVAGFLRKPYHSAELAEVIAKAIAKKGKARESEAA